MVPGGTIAGKGGQDNAGGGGHTETVGNNLSFPVIWSDDNSRLELLGMSGDTSLEVVWPEMVLYNDLYYDAYAQKTEGNVWQAENLVAEGPVLVDEIDWGDSLEVVDMKIGRPVRIELSLYKKADTGLVEPETAYEMTGPMMGYVMAMLANPSSPEEVQGVIAWPASLDQAAEALTYDSYEATVYSSSGGLVLQPLEGLREEIAAGDLRWEPTLSKWVDNNPDDEIGIGEPVALTFSGELNVGGKVIYGLSKGGWKPTAVGDYRATFYLPLNGTVGFDVYTAIRTAEEEVAVAEDDDGGADLGGGSAVVDVANNLTYMDIRVVAGGGGGKKLK